MHFAGKITAHGIYLPTHLQGFWKANEGQVEVKRVFWVQVLLSLDNPARMVGLRWKDSHTGVLWVLFKKKKKRNTHPSEGSHIGLLGGASIPACINSAQLLSGWVLPDGNKEELLSDQEKQECSLPPTCPPQISQSLSPHALMYNTAFIQTWTSKVGGNHHPSYPILQRPSLFPENISALLLENCTLGCWGKKYKQKIKGSSKEELHCRGTWERHTMSQHHKNNSFLASSHRNQSTSQWQTLSPIYNREAETEQNLIQNPARW